MKRKNRNQPYIPKANPNIKRDHIVKTNDNPLEEEGHIVLPAMMVPAFRNTLAVERGVEKNILIKTAGGLGDVICAEPAIRFATETFKDCEISVTTDYPELFQHLKLKAIYDEKIKEPKWKEHYVFQTLYPGNHMQMDFMSPLLTHCVEYMSLCAFRCQMPVKYREVVLKPTPQDEAATYNIGADFVAIHPGRHWQSNTMPKWWWDRVITRIKDNGFTPVIIGKDVVEERGTVDVDTEGCIDMRNKLKIMETVALLQRAKVFLTNDSSPLHMAASGNAWIGFMATAKHPDFITHYRKGGFGWRMKNFSEGGAWEIFDYCPNKKVEVTVNDVGDTLIEWLPEPELMADWACEKIKTEKMVEGHNRALEASL